MGTYTDYDEGNMIIPTTAFPPLQEALPALLEKYHILAEDAAQAPTEQQTYYEHMLTNEARTWSSLAKTWLSLPDEIRPFLSVMRLIARDQGYSVNYGMKTINNEEVTGFTISFGSVKNWDCSLLSDLGPFLYPESYIQVGGDVDVCRYIARNGAIECVYPSWG